MHNWEEFPIFHKDKIWLWRCPNHAYTECPLSFAEYIRSHKAKHWAGQKVHSGFSIWWYGKTRMNFMANPILPVSSSHREHQMGAVAASRWEWGAIPRLAIEESGAVVATDRQLGITQEPSQALLWAHSHSLSLFYRWEAEAGEMK